MIGLKLGIKMHRGDLNIGVQLKYFLTYMACVIHTGPVILRPMDTEDTLILKPSVISPSPKVIPCYVIIRWIVTLGLLLLLSGVQNQDGHS